MYLFSALTVNDCLFVPLRNVAPSGAVTVKEFGSSPRLLPVIEKSSHVTGSSSGTVSVTGVIRPASSVLSIGTLRLPDW